MIKRAAKLRGVPEAALHREAVLERAIHIANSEAGNRAEMLRLAEWVARSQEPRIRIFEAGHAPEETLEAPDGSDVVVSYVVREFPCSRMNEDGNRELMNREDYDFDIVPGELSKADRDALISILLHAGTEFLPVLAEFLEKLRPACGGYKPEITRESLRTAARSRGSVAKPSDPGFRSKNRPEVATSSKVNT